MAIKTLEEKFRRELGDIYDAEHQFLEAQQQMLGQATAPPLRKLLEQHIPQTEQQIKVLEQVFAALGEEASRVKCQGATGLINENKKTLKDVSGNPALIDLAIAGGSAKVEHYEVSCYRGLVAGAEAMGQSKAAKLLQKNLAQEEQTATKIEQSLPKLLQQAMSGAAGTAAAKGAPKTKSTAKAAGAAAGAGAKGSASNATSTTGEVQSPEDGTDHA